MGTPRGGTVHRLRQAIEWGDPQVGTLDQESVRAISYH